MTQSLRIDFVSDIACPWCAIGLASLMRALERTADVVDAEVVLHPFELNPQMGPEGEGLIDYIARKYGRTPAQIAETQTMMRERGAEVGFTFGPREHIYNTFDAHRLVQWAGTQGKQLALKQALLQAYHGEGRNPGARDVLLEAAQAVGLDVDEARNVLDSDAFADEVRDEERRYQSMGIQSVPSIIFNNKYLISGGQPVEAFEQAIREIAAEAKG